MSTILNGAVSAQFNKCTNQQNELGNKFVVSDHSVKTSPLAYAIRALHSDEVCDFRDVSNAVSEAQTQCLDALRTISQCVSREADYAMDQGMYANGKTIANALDMVTQVLGITVDLQQGINRRQGRNQQ